MHRQNPGISLSEFASKIAVLITNESSANYLLRLKTLSRHGKENLAAYTFRAKTIFDESIDPRDYFRMLNTEDYQARLLDAWLSGLNNNALVKMIQQKNIKTLDGAVVFCQDVIKAEVYSKIAKQTSTANGAPNITMEQEALLNNPKDAAKTNANALWEENDDSNDEAEDVNILERPQYRPQGQAQVRQGQTQGQAQGQAPGQLRKPLQNSPLSCFRCGSTSHFAKDCRVQRRPTPMPSRDAAPRFAPRPEQKTNVLLKHSPAQQRRIEKQRRDRARKAAGVYAIETSEDEDDGKIYQEPDTEEEDNDDGDKDNQDDSDEEVANALRAITELVSNLTAKTAKKGN